MLAEPAEVSPQPVILPKQPVLPQKQPPTPMPPVYQQTPARGSRKKLTGICVLLAGILTAEAAVLGFWKPGWFRKKDPADSVSTLVTLREETGTITADSPAVTLCGVTLNADCLNLGSEALSATVADHGETADKNGGPLHQYSISLGDRHQYDDPVALTFPSEHPEQDIVLHYDDTLEMWMPMITAADPEAKTLTACTSSFSDFAVGTIDNGFIRIADPGTPNAHPELCTGLYQKLMEVSNPVLEQTMEQFKPDPKNYRLDMPDEGMTVTVIVSHACYRIAYTYDAYPYEEAINRVPEVIVRAGSAVWELQAMVYAKEKRIESIGSDELNTSMFRGTQKIIADPNSYTYMFDYDSESFEDENYTLSLPGALATAEQMNAVFKSTDTLIVIAEIYENVPENIDYSDWQCLRKSGGLSYGALYLMQGGDAEIPDATDTGNRIMQVTVDSMNLYYRERSAADASENAWQYYEPS